MVSRPPWLSIAPCSGFALNHDVDCRQRPAPAAHARPRPRRLARRPDPRRPPGARRASSRPRRRSWPSSASAAPSSARRSRSCRRPALVETRHGIGTFVVGPAATARRSGSAASSSRRLHDVIAMLELRIGVETEAAGLAAQRRTAEDLAAMRDALDAFSARASRPAATQWAPTSSSISRSCGRPTTRHFTKLMHDLGHDDDPARAPRPGGRGRPRRATATCAASTPSTRHPRRDRQPRRRSGARRRCGPTSPTAASGAAAPHRSATMAPDRTPTTIR